MMMNVDFKRERVEKEIRSGGLCGGTEREREIIQFQHASSFCVSSEEHSYSYCTGSKNKIEFGT